MDTTIQAPRFRSTARLAQWVRRNKPRTRLPSESERCFFRGVEDAKKVSRNLLFYSNYVGDVGEGLESVFLSEDLSQYVRVLHIKGLKPSLGLLSRLNDAQLVWASHFLGRLPEDLEARLQAPSLLSDYANNVGPLPSNLEDIIAESPDAVAQYIYVLKVNFREVPERLLRVLVGHDRHFGKLAQALGSRLPSYLEESISDPNLALNYAKTWVRGRLPEVVEQRAFMSDPRMAVRYAFEVVRGFANVRLPDALHNAVILHGGDESDIRKYVLEVDRCSENSTGDGG